MECWHTKELSLLVDDYETAVGVYNRLKKDEYFGSLQDEQFE